jgi:hypothetical protein
MTLLSASSDPARVPRLTTKASQQIVDIHDAP